MTGRRYLIGSFIALLISWHGVYAQVASQPNPDELQSVLKRVFPKEQIESISVPNGIVLRGTIGQPQDVQTILSIAEQYAETVINALRVGPGTVHKNTLRVPSSPSSREAFRPPQPSRASNSALQARTATTITEAPNEIQKLRAEVKALHDDVRKLIRALEGQKKTTSPPPPKHFTTRKAQVLLNTQLIEVDRAKLPSAFTDLQLFPVGHQGNSGSTIADIRVLRADSAQRIGRVVADLRAENVARIMAEPSLVTVSGRKATFVSGGELPLLVKQLADGSKRFEVHPIGYKAEFLPLMLSNGKIRLELNLSKNEWSKSRSTKTGSIPEIATRARKAAVTVSPDETVVLKLDAPDNSTRETIMLVRVSNISGGAKTSAPNRVHITRKAGDNSPPTDQEVIRAAGITVGPPITSIRIIKEKNGDLIDARPAGNANAHRRHSYYRCTLYIERSGTRKGEKKSETRVVYVDVQQPLNRGR